VSYLAVNRETFDAMMRVHGPRIYTLAMRLTGRPADGQDLAQDTFVKAYEHWESFRAEAEVGTWLYRICVNTWKNRVRYEKRRSFWKHFSLSAAAGPDEEAPAPELPSGEAPPAEVIETADRQGLVQKALSDLEPEDRAILILRDMEDRPYDEIAALLGVPLGTVKSRLARSREKLRQTLAPLLKDEP
jgi:RNA polymerase sigma-70 factor, ECF subfamily